jgi:glucosamine--fructose-6-phosphate aminotransferase (isomerizing)
MHAEIAEIPAVLRRLLADPGESLHAAGMRLRQLDPALLVTVARGSSDHAAAYLKYAIELTAGIPVASLSPSIVSIYATPLKLRQAAGIAISQSGRSPDLLATVEAVRAGGGFTMALTNQTGSPLAALADTAIDLQAGPELSVAATKSFVASVAAGLAILAHWQADAALASALAALPEQLARAIDCDWSSLMPVFETPTSLFVLGRGPAQAIASEAALKFKETCGLHAEAYSAAEVLHGPAAIVRDGFPVLALMSGDAGEPGMAETVARLVDQGAVAFATASVATGATQLPHVATGHKLTEPLCLIVSFYRFIEALSRHRGFDPDHPPHLRKVTETR